MFLESWDWARNGSFGFFRIRGHLSSWEVVKGQIWKWTESRHVICFWKPLEVSMEDLFWVRVSEVVRGCQRLSEAVRGCLRLPEITNMQDWKFPGWVPLLYHKCTTFVVHVVHIGFVPQYVVHISINQWKYGTRIVFHIQIFSLLVFFWKTFFWYPSICKIEKVQDGCYFCTSHVPQLRYMRYIYDMYLNWGT